MSRRHWSAADIAEARELADSGWLLGSIAVHFGVSWNAIHKMLRRTAAAARPEKREAERAANRALKRIIRTRQSPLADPLVAALFEHHRDRAPASLLRRLLPAPIGLPTTLCKACRTPPAPIRAVRAKSQTPPETIALPHVMRPVYPSMRSIMERVLAKHGMSEVAFRADTRAAWVVKVRQEFCYLCALETIQSLPQIGRFIGRDHTTVLHAISRHCQQNDLSPPRRQSLSRSMRSRVAAHLRSLREAEVAAMSA